jgi:poly(A) polymerase
VVEDPRRGVPHFLHRDNTFGTPEEDAFRRDFTINALFYDIATFSIIDYVGGLDDLRAAVVRSIGDPIVRFQEDPVRMLRAVALAARLNFTLDRPVLDAIKQLRHEIARSSPARLLEEYYKILRAGAAEKTFRGLADAGLLEPISEELHRGATEALWRSLAAVDAYRQKFTATPETLTNPVLLGSFLVPLGLSPQLGRPAYTASESGKRRPAIPKMGALPLARRDVERLRQILGLQRRLRDLGASVRAQRALTHRSIFRDGLTWMEVHGETPDLVEHWITVLAERGAEEPVLPAGAVGEMVPFQRRRRRRAPPASAPSHTARFSPASSEFSPQKTFPLCCTLSAAGVKAQSGVTTEEHRGAVGIRNSWMPGPRRPKAWHDVGERFEG